MLICRLSPRRFYEMRLFVEQILLAFSTINRVSQFKHSIKFCLNSSFSIHRWRPFLNPAEILCKATFLPLPHLYRIQDIFSLLQLGPIYTLCSLCAHSVLTLCSLCAHSVERSRKEFSCMPILEFERRSGTPTLGESRRSKNCLHTDLLLSLLSCEGAFFCIVDSLVKENFSLSVHSVERYGKEFHLRVPQSYHIVAMRRIYQTLSSLNNKIYPCGGAYVYIDVPSDGALPPPPALGTSRRPWRR